MLSTPTARPALTLKMLEGYVGAETMQRILTYLLYALALQAPDIG
jgi:hypothetical protein